MLDPQDRVVFHEALEPPEGFVLDEGIGTTYSLDLITLLSAPLAFTSFEWEDSQGQPTSNPVLLLEALRRHIDRLTIFCQAGRIAVPAKPNPLFGFLERGVVEVTSPDPEGVFHPKVWVLRFANPETAEVRYRVICLSRNITDDPSWDLSVVLEGPLKDRKVAFATNHPLGDFIKALPQLAHRACPDEARARAERMAAEIRKVEFQGQDEDPFDEYAFHPIGIDRYKGNPLPEAWARGLVISPFIDATTARELAEGRRGSVLVSRAEELDRIPKQALKDWDRIYVLSSQADGEHEPGHPSDGADTDKPQGLHAKLFVCEDGWDCSLFVGSANATGAAFGKNVEFLVELIGKKSRLGVDQILVPPDGQASMLSLLQEYQSPEEPVDDRIERKLDDLLEAARSAMVQAGWELRASAEGPVGWRLRLVRPSGDDLAIPDDVAVRVWPVSFPAETTARAVERGTMEVEFPVSGVTSLTTFLGCEVTARYEGVEQAVRFALSLPLVGAPAGRREGILRNILDDPQKVLRFLQFLLFDEDSDPMADPGTAAEANGTGGSAAQDGFVLLESLLRALAHDPKRLDEVDKLLKELGDGPEGQSRIPTGLLEIWPAIWQARQGVPA